MSTEYLAPYEIAPWLTHVGEHLIGVRAGVVDVPDVLRIGCSHPAPLNITSFTDVPRQHMLCNACGGQWFNEPRER